MWIVSVIDEGQLTIKYYLSDRNEVQQVLVANVHPDQHIENNVF